MTLIVPLVSFVLLGVGSAVWLAGLPALPAGVSAGQITDVGARLTCAACGAAPILMLSVAYAGFARLPLLLGFVVVPAYILIAVICVVLPEVGRGAVTGFLAGIVAVLAYDLTRLALSYSQGGKDPIPHIGTMLMGSGAPWWLGYLWRTFGNGAGLGVVYGVLCPRKWWGPKTGLAYASMIGLGMILTLWIFPQAQLQLFKLTWQTFVNSCLGHGTYGLVLGLMARAARDRPPKERARGRHAAGATDPGPGDPVPAAAGTGHRPQGGSPRRPAQGSRWR